MTSFFSLYQFFPARAPSNGTAELLELQTRFDVDAGEGRTPIIQALCQLMVLTITVVGAVITGGITGTVI